MLAHYLLVLHLALTCADNESHTDGKFPINVNFYLSEHLYRLGIWHAYLEAGVYLGNGTLVLVLIFVLGVIGGADYFTPEIINYAPLSVISSSSIYLA